MQRLMPLDTLIASASHLHGHDVKETTPAKGTNLPSQLNLAEEVCITAAHAMNLIMCCTLVSCHLESPRWPAIRQLSTPDPHCNRHATISRHCCAHHAGHRACPCLARPSPWPRQLRRHPAAWALQGGTAGSRPHGPLRGKPGAG
jgi:hypothetical protein